MDEWLQLLEIEVKVIPKGCEPVKSEEEIECDRKKASELRKRRNYLIAEMRAVAAERIARVPELQRVAENTGEPVFWRYSFYGKPSVGLVETRYDHPKQKYLAVEYTEEGVYVYRFLRSEGVDSWEPSHGNHTYFSEDDFLRFGGRWKPEEMKMRRVTILCAGDKRPEGYELICSEGFFLSSLLEMQENHRKLVAVYKELAADWAYAKMNHELNNVEERLHDLLLANRLQNGTANVDFPEWTTVDMAAIDVPLWAERRNWTWTEEGVAWDEEFQETEEIWLTSEADHQEEFCVHRGEDGNQGIGLNKPGVFDRAGVNPNELNEKERKDGAEILAVTDEMKMVRWGVMSEETTDVQTSRTEATEEAAEGEMQTGLERIENDLAKKSSFE